MNSARLKARAKARRAYWLGGGGVNEPTPGKEKYPKEDADKIRDTEDKQMVGEPLETGSDGLHPGDLEVKQKLLRAKELEDRRLKRRAYFQGGGGLNEPTPGKEKYPKEEADKIRDNEDKHMTGTGDMGGTDGMFPGDEATKKKLLRAALPLPQLSPEEATQLVISHLVNRTRSRKSRLRKAKGIHKVLM